MNEHKKIKTVQQNATNESNGQSHHLPLGKQVRLLLNAVLLISLFVIVMLSMVHWQQFFRFISGTDKIESVNDLLRTGIVYAIFLFAILESLAVLIVSGVRVAAEWERGIILRFGKFCGVRGPGIVYVIPFIDSVSFVDTRLLTLNIPSQQVITKDNVPAAVDGVLYFLVRDVGQAVLAVQDYSFAVAQYAQATLRDVVGALTLDELLSEREQIQNRVAEVVEERIKSWGLHLDSILLQDIEMPEDLKRIMSRQASAEREKRANITKSEGDKIAASNLAEAARIMATTNGAMKLRTLQTIDGLGTGQSNTVIMFPIELVETIDRLSEAIKNKQS
ncbi:MAG: slipin family protein [Planctomycetaceae bacterium]|jgi:regulator of protease activity HflC (stomatin/prohibitin superfamily)|nr:slipin family protein [Planctomycetaceae bacterium]